MYKRSQTYHLHWFISIFVSMTQSVLTAFNAIMQTLNSLSDSESVCVLVLYLLGRMRFVSLHELGFHFCSFVDSVLSQFHTNEQYPQLTRVSKLTRHKSAFSDFCCS